MITFFPPLPFTQRTAPLLENAPQQVRAVPNAPEVANAPKQRESDAGLDAAQGGGRRLLPVDTDRDGGAERGRLPTELFCNMAQRTRLRRRVDETAAQKRKKAQ